jgi:hypothetical protein
MAKPILPQPTPNGQSPTEVIAEAVLTELTLPGSGHSIVDLQPTFERPYLSSRQALIIGSQACEYLLTGSPSIVTFDPVDLELALVLLRQMAATIGPVLSKVEGPVTGEFPSRPQEVNGE